MTEWVEIIVVSDTVTRALDRKENIFYYYFLENWFMEKVSAALQIQSALSKIWISSFVYEGCLKI